MVTAAATVRAIAGQDVDKDREAMPPVGSYPTRVVAAMGAAATVWCLLCARHELSQSMTSVAMHIAADCKVVAVGSAAWQAFATSTHGDEVDGPARAARAPAATDAHPVTPHAPSYWYSAVQSASMSALWCLCQVPLVALVTAFVVGAALVDGATLLALTARAVVHAAAVGFTTGNPSHLVLVMAVTAATAHVVLRPSQQRTAPNGKSESSSEPRHTPRGARPAAQLRAACCTVTPQVMSKRRLDSDSSGGSSGLEPATGGRQRLVDVIVAAGRSAIAAATPSRHAITAAIHAWTPRFLCNEASPSPDGDAAGAIPCPVCVHRALPSEVARCRRQHCQYFVCARCLPKLPPGLRCPNCQMIGGLQEPRGLSPVAMAAMVA